MLSSGKAVSLNSANDEGNKSRRQVHFHERGTLTLSGNSADLSISHLFDVFLHLLYTQQRHAGAKHFSQVTG